MSRPALRTALPPWLAHALRAQRGPVPWNAVVRGALAGGPLLTLALLAGHLSLGVVAALGAMLAGINDRPGSRRVSVQRLGVPALAGALGLLIGTYAGQYASAYADRHASGGPGQYAGAVALTLLLTSLGLLAGGMSAVGPVASGAGTQLLVATAIGAGMPLPEPGWERALGYLAGAGWLLALRLVLPTPSALTGGDYRFDGERDAVAAVYDAIAALLDAVGTPDATARRAALTAALDHAQDALTGPRLRRYASSSTERRLHAQYTAALPLAEAATALAWTGDHIDGRASAGPRRLAEAVRGNTATGPLPAPARSAPALRALDDALLHAAEAFDRGDARTLPTRRRTVGSLLRLALGTGGREYGLRVALSFGASAAVAQALHHEHWYWLPATAVFLVKPDLGPLVSRVLCRAAGTVLGAVLFAGCAAVLPRPEGLVVLVAVSGALIPVATRHFAAQTAVVTVLVLALVMVGGEPQASWSRIGETLLACAIVLIVGHLPIPKGQRGGGVRARLDEAAAAAHLYLAHVLESDDRAARWTLRREAYRTLARARTAIALAGAEHPALARHSEGTDEIAAVLEQLVDTTTACAVHLDDTGRLGRHHTEQLTALLDQLARHQRHTGISLPDVPDVPDAPDALDVRETQGGAGGAGEAGAGVGGVEGRRGVGSRLTA
ncbi:FUSC family protein [Streptomyces neyagawaensis]|uniref:FUSC family protein n=1 Tax=Streptomyces neyagawaensis TaxID=42238 RepID=A0ABV3AUZ5_9ACTN